MNYVILPDLLAIGGLVVVFVLLLGRTQQPRLHFWVVGWLLILVHFFAELPTHGASITGNTLVSIAICALLLSSVAFVWASRAADHARMWMLGSCGALFDIAFCVAAIFGMAWPPVYPLLTAVGGAISLIAYCGWKSDAHPEVKYGRAAFIVIAYGIQLALVIAGNITLGVIWLLCWHYLATAIEFRLGATRASIGVVFTTVCFVAWALVFPLGFAMSVWLPDTPIAPGVWNLPKYLVATGLLVTLLEEQRFKFERASLHDALTHIPNRRMLLNALDNAARNASEGQPFAFMILDLDLFKEINDRLGHLIGDHLLQSVATRLRTVVRHNDILARLGGDEFAVLLPSMNDHVAARMVIEKIEKSMREPFVIDNVDYRIGASIGYALAPADGVDARRLYALADKRMYEAKEAGRREPAPLETVGEMIARSAI
jgi:diguanylate cyclase (GGDEF)-like protein